MQFYGLSSPLADKRDLCLHCCRRSLYLELLHELDAAIITASQPAPVKLTFSCLRGDEPTTRRRRRRNRWDRIKGDLPPSLPLSLPSRYRPIHPSFDRPTIAHSSPPLARSLALHMPLRSLRGNRPTNERVRQRRSGGGCGAAAATATLRQLIMLTTSMAALTTLINEVLRLNGGTVSSVASPVRVDDGL